MRLAQKRLRWPDHPDRDAAAGYRAKRSRLRAGRRAVMIMRPDDEILREKRVGRLNRASIRIADDAFGVRHKIKTSAFW